MPKRLQVGDVLEIKASAGFAYVILVGRHPEYGDAIAVCPGVSAHEVKEVAELSFSDGYVTFYPARAAVAQGLATVVGRTVAPPMPRFFRRPGAVYGTTVETWVIESESGDVVKRVLSDADRRLPIAAIWNHEYLLQRIGEGWRPENEV